MVSISPMVHFNNSHFDSCCRFCSSFFFKRSLNAMQKGKKASHHSFTPLFDAIKVQYRFPLMGIKGARSFYRVKLMWKVADSNSIILSTASERASERRKKSWTKAFKKFFWQMIFHLSSIGSSNRMLKTYTKLNRDTKQVNEQVCAASANVPNCTSMCVVMLFSSTFFASNYYQSKLIYL